MGAKAEPAESEHSISNNLKFCVVILGLFFNWLAGKGALGLWPAGIKCQITRYARGSLKSEQCFCSTSCYAVRSARARRLCLLFRLTCASKGSGLRKTPQSNNTSPTSKWLRVKKRGMMLWGGHVRTLTRCVYTCSVTSQMAFARTATSTLTRAVAQWCRRLKWFGTS